MKYLFRTSVWIVAIGFLLGSCQKTGRPVRKKIPDLTSLEDAWSLHKPAAGNGLPFYTYDLTLAADGGLQQYVYVPLPDASGDSAIIQLVNNFKPLAIPLLSNWASLQKNGVLIDLRSSNSGTKKAQFVISKQAAFAVPVTFMWDEYSAARAGVYIGLLQTVPAVAIQGNRAQAGRNGNMDCFAPASPVITPQ